MQSIYKQNKTSFSFLRTILCLLVICDHTGILTGVWKTTNLSVIFSVPAFFILSGFWVTKSYLCSGSIKEYFLKRIKKIFPEYFTVVVACAFGFVFFSSLNIHDYFVNAGFVKYLLANISTLNFICNSLPGINVPYGINGSLWTIKVELGFYIILPVILLLITKINSKDSTNRNGGGYKNFFIISLYLISVLCSLFLLFVISKLGLPTSLNNQLPSLFCYFAAGMLCFFNLDLLLKCGKFIILPAVVFCILYYIFRWKFLFIFYPLSLAIVIIWIGFKFTHFSSLRDYSYGMYLTHFPIINILCFSNLFSLHPVTGLLIVIALSFSCSYWMISLEKKFIK